MFEKNASYLYVGNVARGTDTLAGMASGSLAVVNEAGTVQTSTIMSSNAKYRIAQKLASGKLIFSDWFNPTLIKNLTGKSYVAPTYQTSYLGYNGASGSLDATANEDFVLHVEWKNTAGFYNNKPLLVSGAYHTSAASQAELSLGLLESLDANLKRAAFKFVVPDRINSAAVTTDNGLDYNATVVLNSNKITVATAITYDTGTSIVAGDYIRLGSVGGGTALTSPVYKVTAVNSLVLTLDRPVTVASGTYAAATYDAEVIPAATAVAANFGLKFVAQTNSTFDPIVDTYAITRFGLLLNDAFTTATVTNSTLSSEGIGNPKKLANQEIYSQFLDKSPFISAYPRNNYRQEISTSNTYDVISFEVNDPVDTYVTTGLTYNKRVSFTLATKVALDGDGVDAVFGFTL